MLGWSILRLLDCGVESVVVALPQDRLAGAREIVDDSRVIWVEGGSTRQDSVARCLDAMDAGAVDLVMVHDGARPAVAIADVVATVEAAKECGGAVLGRPVSDTVKRVAAERIVGTVDRGNLFRAETPQVFRASILRRAFERAQEEGFQGTDEASLVERLPRAEIAVVEAVYPNPKLTTPADLPRIRALLEGEPSPECVADDSWAKPLRR